MGLMNNIGSWMLNRMAGDSSAAADDDDAGSARPVSPTCQLVGEDVYEDDMIDVQIPASSHFERYRTLIDSFDEDRESPLEKIVRWFFLLMAYLLPLAVAYAMGKEIGDAYGGVFNLADGWSLGTHTVAMAGEFALAMMTLSCAAALRKMTTDASYAPKFVGSLAAFLLFSLASGLAQWFIALLHVGGLHSPAALAALIFRVAMVPAVDIASLLFLAVMNYKSLKKFVADQRVRAQAIRDINEAELEIQRAQSAASRRETEERQDLQTKEQRNQVWLELDRLHAQGMIAHAKQRAIGTSVTPEDALPGSAADVPMIEQVKVRRIDRSS
jgi:mannitol-specific phosphotransferase system IIBC component